MDYVFAIRGIIFLVAALIVLIFPKQVYRFQCWALKGLHIKWSGTIKDVPYRKFGACFLVIAIIMFIYSISA